MLALKYSGKIQFFFEKFHRRVRIARNQALYRTAGLIRAACRRTIRVRARASNPPSPPHAHTRGGIREIRFSVFGDSAIIGPIKFAGSNFFDQPVPHIHEFGGTYIARRFLATYPERPYMSATLRRLHEQGAIPRQFSAVVARIL